MRFQGMANVSKWQRWQQSHFKRTHSETSAVEYFRLEFARHSIDNVEILVMFELRIDRFVKVVEYPHALRHVITETLLPFVNEIFDNIMLVGVLVAAFLDLGLDELNHIRRVFHVTAVHCKLRILALFVRHLDAEDLLFIRIFGTIRLKF